jgi:nucleoside-diphosphate-sugar epimerase
MIVITTPTGQIGRQVLGNLLDSGEQLRVIARDPSQLPAEVREDLDIVEGSHGGLRLRRSRARPVPDRAQNQAYLRSLMGYR